MRVINPLYPSTFIKTTNNNLCNQQTVNSFSRRMMSNVKLDCARESRGSIGINSYPSAQELLVQGDMMATVPSTSTFDLRNGNTEKIS